MEEGGVVESSIVRAEEDLNLKQSRQTDNSEHRGTNRNRVAASGINNPAQQQPVPATASCGPGQD